MLGFEPVGAEAASRVDTDLVQVDAALTTGGYRRLHALIDDWMVVSVGDPQWVYAWWGVWLVYTTRYCKGES